MIILDQFTHFQEIEPILAEYGLRHAYRPGRNSMNEFCDLEDAGGKVIATYQILGKVVEGKPHTYVLIDCDFDSKIKIGVSQ